MGLNSLFLFFPEHFCRLSLELSFNEIIFQDEDRQNQFSASTLKESTY